MGRFVGAGANRYLGISSGIPTLPNVGSVTLWVNPQHTMTDSALHIYLMMGKYPGGEAWTFVISKGPDNKVYAGWYPNAEKRVVLADAGNYLKSNMWNFIALTWTTVGNATTLYVGGLPMGASQCTNWDTSTAEKFLIGDLGDGTGLANAWIADVCFYNAVLTGAQVIDISQVNSYPASLTNRYKLIGNDDPEWDDVGTYPDLPLVGVNAQTYDITYYPANPRTVPRNIFGAGTATQESGANARGGSGNCLKMNPSKTTVPLNYEFLVPVTAATEFSLSFWHKITASFNGSVEVTIFDSDDDVTELLSAESVTLTDDASYHQYVSTAVEPTSTGFCRVLIAVKDGSTTGDVYIDDLAA